MTRKKREIHGLEKALENVPEEERASLAAQLEEEFRDFDPDDQPGERVPSVAFGTRICPSCSGTLVELGVLPTPNGETICVLECESCDGTFSEGPAAPLQ
jgi:hypothetical protein